MRKIENSENIECAVGLPIQNTFKSVCQFNKIHNAFTI